MHEMDSETCEATGVSPENDGRDATIIYRATMAAEHSLNRPPPRSMVGSLLRAVRRCLLGALSC